MLHLIFYIKCSIGQRNVKHKKNSESKDLLDLIKGVLNLSLVDEEETQVGVVTVSTTQFSIFPVLVPNYLRAQFLKYLC